MHHAPSSSRRSQPHGGWTGLIVALACSLPAVAASPAIERIMPPGGPQGAEMEVEFRGRDLDEAREIVFSTAPIAVADIRQVDPQTVKATLRIPADCPLGNHPLRIRTADGLSDLRTFRVAGFAQVQETEPNNERSAAQPVTLPTTVVGVVPGEDIDCYRVRLPAGGRVAAAIDAMRLDQELFDPHLELVDDKGFVVAACDDHPLLAQDGMLAAVAPAAGDYLVRVRESAFGGNGGCVYMLHFGDFPVPHLAWPPAGRPGETIEVSWLGDPAGPFRQTLTLPARPTCGGVAEIVPVRDGVAAAVPVPLRLSPLARSAEVEPDDEPGQATPVTAPAGILGRMDRAADVDWFRVAAPPGTAWNVRAWARQVGSPIDVVVNVHRDDAKRERLTGNDDADGPDSAVRVTVPEQGSFLVRVNEHLRRHGPEYVYWLEIERVEQAVALSITPARDNTQERLVAAVPRGNRTALVFNTSRTDCGAAVKLALAGLPAGVRADAPDAAPNAPATPVVFEAAADAPPAVADVEVLSLAADSGRPLGGLRQTTPLVVVGNVGLFRAVSGERLPVAVVDEALIRIDVDPPAVPLVRRGALDLAVRVTRLGGFTGRVKLALPFRPPGVSGPTAVEVPADQDTAVYPLNASPDAVLADWRIVVAATALVKNEPQPRGADAKQPRKRRRDGEAGWVSSGLVPLRVTEPLLELAADKTTVEQGRETQLVWAVKKPAAFAGAAKVKLLGLPAQAEAPELDLAADATQVVFPLKVGTASPPGQHGNVFCQVRIPQGDAWVVQNTAPMQLRIDKPLPEKEAPP